MEAIECKYNKKELLLISGLVSENGTRRQARFLTGFFVLQASQRAPASRRAVVMASANNGASAEGYTGRLAAVGRQSASADAGLCVCVCMYVCVCVLRECLSWCEKQNACMHVHGKSWHQCLVRLCLCLCLCLCVSFCTLSEK